MFLGVAFCCVGVWCVWCVVADVVVGGAAAVVVIIVVFGGGGGGGVHVSCP